MYITKQQAIDTLYRLNDSEILDSELEDDISSQAKHCEELEKKYSLEGRIYDALLHADAGLKTHDLARLIAEKIMAEPGADNAD